VFPFRRRSESAGLPVPPKGTTSAAKRRVLVVCTHLRPGRIKRRSRYVMQPITGLHIGSLIDRQKFDVRLYHEDWHGPFDPRDAGGFDLVFLTGLQADFDRMRQLSYYFRRTGAKVVAGGSICTMFPEFAAQFFDAVCAGGVDCVPDVVADFEHGRLKAVYRSPAIRISAYSVDYSLLREAGIDPSSHLVEASRGCSFRCNFCVMPKEFGGHASYELPLLAAAIDNSLAQTPCFSFRRWYPTIIFMDNNFSDDRARMIEVCELLRNHRKVRGWAALVTQNVLHDRELVRYLARAKCMTLFVGLESFDHEFLRRQNKKQNLSARYNVLDDIAFAESLGIGIGYGYLFDPRHQNVTDMERQIRGIGENPILPMPVYLSVVAPLAGTDTFWSNLAAGELAPHLRLRDLDGETIAYSNLADDQAYLTAFVEKLFRRPWEIVSRFTILKKTLRRIARSGSFDPFHWYIIAAANLHCFVWSSTSPAKPRTYIAGTEVLDPQYDERPDDLSSDDCRRYFEPVVLTDAMGGPVDWLKPYIPAAAGARKKATSASRAGQRALEVPA
jgi:hypothetical protein